MSKTNCAIDVSVTTESPLRYPRLLRRVQAVLIDSVIISLSYWTILLLLGIFPATPAVLKALMFIVPILVLEPGLVAWAGGTIGHHLLGLRVTSTKYDKRLNYVQALLRFAVKVLFGWSALVSILVSKRHQALHDFAVGSLVVHEDYAHLPDYEVLQERQLHSGGYWYPARWRRSVAIIVYGMLATVLMYSLASSSMSEVCLVHGLCSWQDQVIDVVMSIIWFALLAAVVFFGWRGRLYGCRRTPKT